MHDAYRAYERQQKLAQPQMVSDPAQFARYFKKSGTPWERPFSLRDAFPYGASFPISMLSAYTEQEFYKAIAENWMDSPSDYSRASAAVVGGPEQWEQLAKDESVLVRAAVAQYAGDEFRAELLGDPDPVVRRNIARNAGDALRKSLLGRERDPEVAKTACQYASSTDTADSLAGTHWDSPRVLAACAPYMGKEALGKLSGHPDAAVRMAAAKHGGVEICRQVLIREEDLLNRHMLEELLADMEAEEQEEQRRQAEADKAQKKDNARLCLWAAAQTEALVLQDKESWGNFLETAGRVYKYPYEDALLIFSQRPEAAACAEADLWSSRMGRQVVREDRAIVLAAEDKNGAYLRYVYDVSDTEGRPFPRPWQYGPRFGEAVGKAFRQAYGTKGETLPALVESAARRLLDRQFPEAGEYRGFIESSACYMVLSRCGQQPEKDFSRFLPLEGDRREIHMAARTAVQISSALLRQVERAVRETVLESHRRQRRPPAQTPGQVSFFSMDPEKAEAPAPQKDSPPPEKEPQKPAGLSQTVLDESLRVGANDPESRYLEKPAENEPGTTSAPAIRELYEQYKPKVIEAVMQDEAYRNACRNSDKESARLECDAAIKHAVPEINNLQLTKLYYDVAEFHTRLHRDVWEETYPVLSAPEQESAPAPSLSMDPSRPYIFCEWSESEVFQDKTSYSLAEFDRLMKETDSHYVKKQAEGIKKYGSWQAMYDADDPEYSPYLGYDKVKFTLHMPDGSSYTERQDIGDGDGGVIDFLSQYEKYRDIVPILRKAVRQEREKPAATPPAEEKASVRDPDGWLVSGEDPAVRKHFPAPAQASDPGRQEKPAPAPNFRITDETLGIGGAKAHYKMNADAIRLLRQLRAENRQATPEEQDILSKYAGWGGLADAFDESKPAWASEYRELRELLSPEEYESARASTLNSHYTTPVVIRAMYQALENMGFQGGRILEPAMGTGNFFGCLPDSMEKSRLYGVELDSLTGQIARQLYPQADIKIAGFETTSRHDFYDLAIGNVPFGQYQVHDPTYNRLGFSIHNYFFAKALDQVRSGGVLAFLTSRHTLDSKDTKVRKYLAERADLLGAVRLPNNTFKDNAGTEVVSDILFLQKRGSPPEQEPAWVQTGESALGFRINQYFLDNPRMVLGVETAKSTQYAGQDYTVAPAPGADLAGQLAQAVTHIHGTYQEAGPRQEEEKSVSLEDVKPYSFAVIDGEVYYREGESLEKPKLRGDAGERVKAMVSLRDCTRRLLRLQMEDAPEGEIRQAQGELNRLHDSFLERFGLINDRKNARAFDRDSSYYLLCSLEEVGKNGELKRKADIFTKRTIQPHRPVTHTETAAEALAVSLGERAKVDLPFMARLTGKAEEEIYQELKGIIFLNPLFGQGPGEEKYLSADEYLSGNVREKWQAAKEAAKGAPAFQVNVEALERVQPRPLTAAEIDARLGAVWIEPAYIDQFMAEAFGLSPAAATRTHAFYSAATGEWQVHGVHATALSDRFGTTRKSAYEVLEASLNQRPVRVVDYTEDPRTHKRTGRVNERETTLARGKQQALRQAFKDWLWKDPQRRQTLTARYNQLYNSTRPREYDGSHLVFDGINPEIRLRKHQLDAIARTIYGGNTLLAHCVGAGKSYEIAAAAMEMKRLGLCHKSLIAVPNHIVGQWGIEFLKLYPAANILVAKETDFSAQNRKKFCARIATGNYDAVIIGHSQFAFLPLSQKRQEEGLRREIQQVEQGMKQAKKESGEGARFTIKQMERAKRSLETRLQRLQDGVKRDDVTSFEELGVDRLFIDEAHEFKNLSFVTKMGTVAGLNPEGSMKAYDLLMKCRYLDEITGEKGVVLATGTPVSNSVAELYTMMRYVQNSTLQEMGWGFFDNWAAHFAETVTEAELAPEGTGYRERTRLARFTNLPELMNIFREAADIKTAEDVGLPVPEVEFHVEKAQPSPEQEALVRELSARAEAVHDKMVSPAEDNLLKITTDGRRLGLDQRLLDPSLPDFPGSKVNMCAASVLRIWREGQAEKTTQLIFCDTSTPKGKAGAPQAFNVYDDIYKKLTAGGIPPEEIAFIHDYPKREQKNALFEKVRTGEVRVLLGSTEKMGSGMNVQDRLIACHDLDCRATRS